MPAEEPVSENITQELYKKNAELAVKNKTLSLLSKLYEISILTLEPAALAKQITQTIQTELEFNLVGILHYHDDSDQLTSLYLAKSKRFEQALGDAGTAFDNVTISQASKHGLFKEILSGLSMGHTENLTAVWDGLISQEKWEAIKEEAHVHTLLLYPLIIENQRILGVLLIGPNRLYANLSEFEQESIRSFVNVIATALDKALLYLQLQITNDKLAHANNSLNHANEELKKLDAAKSEFLSIASHQLRAPLTVVKGYLSLALEGTLGLLPKQAQEPLGRAAFATNQLIKLVNDLLNLSRMEAGKITYAFAMNNISLIIKEVIQELTPQAEEKKLKVILEPKEDLEQFIFDRDKMREAVINFIHNAVKYTPAGGDILIRQEIVSRDMKKFVRFSIKDNGMGIAPEDIHRLFTKFVRSTEAKTIDANGMGLGLFFVKKVIEDHGGKCWAESEGLGKGSTFVAEIPFKK